MAWTISAATEHDYQVRLTASGWPTNTGYWPYIVRTQSGMPSIVIDAAPANRKGTPPASLTVTDFPPFNAAVQYHVKMRGLTTTAASGVVKLTTTRVGVNIRDTRPDGVGGWDQVWCDLVSDERSYPSRTVTHEIIGATQPVHLVRPPSCPVGTLTIRLDTLEERAKWATVRDSGWPMHVRCTDQSEWQDGKIIVPQGGAVRQYRAELDHRNYDPVRPRSVIVEIPYMWVGLETDQYVAALDEPDPLILDVLDLGGRQ